MATQEPVQESSLLNLSLGLKETSIPLNDVSTSPTKKNEPKFVYLFGARISVPSQDSLDITAKKTSEIELDIDQSTMSFDENSRSLFSSSPMKTDQTSKTPESYSLASTATSKRKRTKSLLGRACLGSNPKNPKEELKEHASKIKKIKKERNEENRAGVSMELDLNIPHCTIMKTLTASDVNSLSRLLIDTSHAERHILRYMSEDDQRRIQEGEGVKVKAYDHNTETEQSLVFKRWYKTSKSYLFNGGWSKEFVRRRDLKEGDKIGLLWDDVESILHFWVLPRAHANQENPN